MEILRKRDNFLQRLRDEFGNWTDDCSPEREEIIWKLTGFLADAENLSLKFESLQGKVFSDYTYRSIMSVLPRYLRYKIYEKVHTTEISNGIKNSLSQTFKNIQEVLSMEASHEAFAAQYSEAIAKNQRVYGKVREDESRETIENSERLAEKKTVCVKKGFSKRRAQEARLSFSENI